MMFLKNLKYPLSIECRKNILVYLILIVYVYLCQLASAQDHLGIIYIDPTNQNDPYENGSQTHPYDSWFDVTWMSGYAYLQKAGTSAWGDILAITASGTALNDIKIGSYGISDTRPRIRGSCLLNGPDDWESNTQSNIWQSTAYDWPTSGRCLVKNPSFSFNDHHWYFLCDGQFAEGGRTTEVYYSYPASYYIYSNGSGNAVHQIQLRCNEFSVNKGEYYKLTFRAKSAKNSFRIDNINISQNPSPYTNYGASLRRADVNTTWELYTLYFRAIISNDDACLRFCVGDMPEDTLYLDDVVLKKCTVTNPFPYCDIGNIKFGTGEGYGKKVLGAESLVNQGDFYYDEGNSRILMYSASNPATYYSNIECAMHIPAILIDNQDYITIEDIWISNIGYHGIDCHTVDHIIIRDCYISDIGGCLQYGTTRYGNGIQFWNTASYCTIERSKFWECYDEAITNQGFDGNVHHMRYCYNMIYNTELAITSWLAGDDEDQLHNIFIENNTIYNSGNQHSHSHRPDPRAMCIEVNWNDGVDAHDIFIRNNIMAYSTERLLIVRPYSQPPITINNFVVDYNCFYQLGETADAIWWCDQIYDINHVLGDIIGYWQFDAEQGDNCLVDDPDFVNYQAPDIHIIASSPCKDAGLFMGLTTDIDGNAVPYNIFTDIGADEYVPITPPRGINNNMNNQQNINVDNIIHNVFNSKVAGINLHIMANNSVLLNISVFNTAGCRVRTLVSKHIDCGSYTFSWDGKDDRNNILPNGIYFLTVETSNQKEIKKVVLLH